MYKDINLVVGAGFSGAVTARKIADEIKENVFVIDIKNHIGGNSHDYKDRNNITIHKYGSHIFHTDNERVWKFLNRFGSFNTYMHKVYAVIDGIKTTIPFNFNSLYNVFPAFLAKRLEEKLLQTFRYNTRVPILELRKNNDPDLIFLSDYIYKKVFLNYTKKQWNNNPENIDSAVTARVPVMIGKDERYFKDKYQGIPQEGYSSLISNMLNHPNIRVYLNTDYKKFKNIEFKRIFYTGSIDEYFDYKYGMLPYRSVSFKFEEFEQEYYQENSVVNYPDNYDFTRVHEFKHYLLEKSDKTVIAKEYSTEFNPQINDRYYPIVNETNISLYNKYRNLAKQYRNLYFLGRLGDYRYYDIDKAIARALVCFDEVFSGAAQLN